MRVGCAVLVLVAAVSPACSTAEPATSERALVALAEAYRSGDRQRAVAEIGLWSRESVEKEVDLLAGVSTSEASTPRRRAAMALLAESALRDLRIGTFPSVRWTLLSAARLAEVVPRANRPVTFERRFFLFAALALHCGGHLDSGYALLLRAQEVLKALGEGENDAELLEGLARVGRHRLKVSVKRKGVEVRARQEYVVRAPAER